MPADLAHIEEIFAAALSKADAPARAAYLDEACGGDADLRARVDALLAAHAATGNFLKLPDHDVLVREPEASAPGAGATIGPYKLLEQIGEGGMGVVFMAEQERPVRRRVAIKIIKPGMDTRQVIARFEAERQALALMDHPNIAKVLDAGTTGDSSPPSLAPRNSQLAPSSGRPYFVMELVRGVPITDYCDRERLTVRQRLELFTQVCHAVQHAHQKGVIHRDLKPSNVLVAEYDGRPVPKIIDFGVAKATAQPLTERTMFTHYGQLIGTFEYMSPEQARFNQLDVDTRSDIYSLGILLYQLLTGSTPLEQQRRETIAFDETLRIIREEEPPNPSTRLSGAEALPTIAANRHTEPARLGKEVRGELDWIVMKALEKDRNRRYDTAGALAADIRRHLDDKPLAAGPPSRLYRTSKFVRRHKAPVIAAAVLVIGVLAGVIGGAAALVSQSRQRAAAERERAEAQLNLAAALQSLGKYDEAEKLFRQAIARPKQAGRQARQNAARTKLQLAQVVRQQHGAAAAEPLYREALAEYRGAFSPNDANIAFAATEVAFMLRDGLHKYRDAEALFRERLSVYRHIHPVNHYQIAWSLLNIGNALAWQNKYAEAAKVYHESVNEYQVALPEGDPTLAAARMEYAYVLIALDRLPEAEALLLQSEKSLRNNASSRVFTAGALSCLYARWNQLEPSQGYDAKALQWISKILDAYFNLGERWSQGGGPASTAETQEKRDQR